MAKNKNRKKSILKVFLFSFIGIMLFCLITVVILWCIYGDRIKKCYAVAETKIQSISANEFSNSQTSLVYDRDNNLLMKIKGDKENYYLRYNDIPETVNNAFIAIEDHRFLEHHGIDYIATLRAFVSILLNKGELVQGGSTITQQLARNVFLTTEKSMERKVTELFIALGLERKYSKEDILEFYINNINYSNGCYGIEAAAQEYFGKSCKDLSDSEMVFLCAIPQNPTYHNPRKYLTNTLRRRDNIIRAMLEYHYITAQEAEEMLSEKITIINREDTTTHNYMETYAKHAAVEVIMKEVLGFEFRYTLTDKEREEYKKEYDKAYTDASNKLETDGYTVYTSLSLLQQGIVQNALDEILQSYTSVTTDGEYSLQGAVTVIENDTGLVTAIVGGRTPLNHVYTLNRAFQSYRQPGSTIKPLVAYTPYFEDDTHNVTDIRRDYTEPEFNGQKVPKGTGRRTTILNAVKWSYNAIPWNIVRELTPDKSLSYLANMNFSKLVDSDKVESISLGGFTYGVSTVEMASAYSTLARNGLFVEPTCITKIVDNEGTVIFSNKNIEPKRVYSEQSCVKMRECLSSVVHGGTGSSANMVGIEVVGKTGTSNNEKDSWFAGSTPYYSAAIWVGHDTPKSEPSVSKKKITATLFKNIMTPIHDALQDKSKQFNNNFNTQPTNQRQSASIFEEVYNSCTTLDSINIIDEKTLNSFNSQYNDIKSLIISSKDLVTQQEYEMLMSELDNVKRNKWDSILSVESDIKEKDTQNGSTKITINSFPDIEESEHEVIPFNSIDMNNLTEESEEMSQ